MIPPAPTGRSPVKGFKVFANRGMEIDVTASFPHAPAPQPATCAAWDGGPVRRLFEAIEAARTR